MKTQAGENISRALEPAVEEIRKYPLIIQALPILADSRVKHRNG